MAKGQMARSSTASQGISTEHASTLAANFKAKLDVEADTVDVGNASDIQDQVIARMLEAETIEDAFAAQDSSLPSGKDLVDVDHMVTDFTIVRSEGRFESGIGYYARVQATYEDGSPFQYTVGAANVVTLLWVLRQRNGLPAMVRIQSRETRNGELLMLRLLPPR